MRLEGGGLLRVGPGQVTDDSEMAMCLLGAANDDVEYLNLNFIQEYFGKWRSSSPFDIGTTTSKGLRVINLKKINPTDSFI